MFVVAIGRLAGALEAEAAALAADLGTTAYDARLCLSAGLPAIVLTTPSRERALAVLAAVRGRGHLAVACDAEAVVSSAEMVSMKAFDIDDEGAIAGAASGAGAGAGESRLPWGDVFALLPATHRRTVDVHTKEKERKFNAGLAIATSGVVLTKTVTKEKRTHTEEREHVLYVFRRSGERPWIVFENGTVYTKLAELGKLAPARLDNFREVVRIVRDRATNAVYDDRLMSLRRVPEKAQMAGVSRNSTVTTSSDAGMDLLAHLLALLLLKEGRGSSPYRTA
jgi:hypothetical protein